MTKISKVVKDGVCSGCGLCAAFCPHNAIYMHKEPNGFSIPIIRAPKCTNCGLCFELCPSCSVQRKQLNVIDTPFTNLLIGRYIAVYRGYANDFKIRWSASSGGIVTSLLIFLMKQKLVDGVIVTVMDHKNPLNAKAIFTSSEEDILRGIGSKYAPVTMHESIRYAVKNSFKFAIVGLPCHIEALSRAEKKITNLRKLVFLKLGLYCNNVPSIDATKYILWCFNIPIEEVVEIRYRGYGWPGYMVIKLRTNKKIKIPFVYYWNSGFGQYFTNKRCLLCSDHAAELADISVADPWTIRFIDKNYEAKESLIVVRSKVGYEIIQSAMRQGYISLSSIDPAYAVQPTTLFKKKNKNSRSLRIILGAKVTPYEYLYTLPLDLRTVIQLLTYRINRFVSARHTLWPLLKITGHIHSCIYHSWENAK